MMKQPIVLIDGEEKKVTSVNFGENFPLNFEIEEEGPDGWDLYFKYDEENKVWLDSNGKEVKVYLKC